jgi:hypothetical protein
MIEQQETTYPTTKRQCRHTNTTQKEKARKEIWGKKKGIAKKTKHTSVSKTTVFCFPPPFLNKKAERGERNKNKKKTD